MAGGDGHSVNIKAGNLLAQECVMYYLENYDICYYSKDQLFDSR